MKFQTIISILISRVSIELNMDDKSEGWPYMTESLLISHLLYWKKHPWGGVDTLKALLTQITSVASQEGHCGYCILPEGKSSSWFDYLSCTVTRIQNLIILFDVPSYYGLNVYVPKIHIFKPTPQMMLLGGGTFGK